LKKERATEDWLRSGYELTFYSVMRDRERSHKEVKSEEIDGQIGRLSIDRAINCHH